MINPYSIEIYSSYDEYDEIDDSIITKDIERAWVEHELEEQINALLNERKVRRVEREYQIERIAKDAVYKDITLSTIYKFFDKYNISQREQIIFWQKYFKYKL